MSITKDHPHSRVRAALAPRASLISLTTVRPDLVEVVMGKATLGYIEVVGSVFVSLSGSRYDLAVEVSQSLIFEDALTALTALRV